MAQSSSPPETSPFAPPRAGRGRRAWALWFGLRRSLKLQRVRLPAFAIHPLTSLAVFFVPLHGLRYVNLPPLVRAAPYLFFVGVVVAAGAYGQMAGGIAFGLLVALHVIGLTAFMDIDTPLPAALRMARRFGLALGAALVLPILADRLISRIAIPVATAEGPRIVLTLGASAPPVTGELIAYRLPRSYEAGTAITEGVYLGRVLGGPGSAIRFGKDGYRLDDRLFPALPHMPAEGEFKAEPGQALVWPTELHFSRSGGRFPAAFTVVNDSALVGRPCKRWFWRTWTTP